MKKISSNSEVVVIFERNDNEGAVSLFYPIDAMIGEADVKKKVFRSLDGKREYPFIFDTKDKYSFGLRNKLGYVNSTYHEKNVRKLLKKYVEGLQQFTFYFGKVPEMGYEIQFVCEDDDKNVFILNDRDFDSYKKHRIKMSEFHEEVVNVRELVNELKKKIIGQDEAISDVASIIWQNSKSERKQNILLIGPTGVGKTEIVRIISEKLGVPMVIANAANLTQSGYVGKSVDDILSDLLLKCGNDVNKASHGIIVIDEIDKLACSDFVSGGVSTGGVQDELLKLIEDGEYTVSVADNDSLIGTSEVVINTKYITVIGMGAFSTLLKKKQEEKSGAKKIGFCNVDASLVHSSSVSDRDLVKYGLKQELVGRFTNLIELKPLTKDNLIAIMKNPNEKLIHDKIDLLKSMGVTVEIKESVYDKIASGAILKETGARGLIGSIDGLFTKALTEISLNENVYEKLIIDDDTVDDHKKYKLEKKK